MEQPDRQPPENQRPEFKKRARVAAIVASVAIVAGALGMGWHYDRQHESRSALSANEPRWHSAITTTVFWVGEEADESNDFIQNRSSAFNEDWMTAFGGMDDPKNRCGYAPCGFTPKENAFYFALPYNYVDDDCNLRPNVHDIPWYSQAGVQDGTIIKNRWIEVKYQADGQTRTAYAQWQDVGPFNDNDAAYVWDMAAKTRPAEHRAGLDISPATADYLKLDGRGKTRWRFVDEHQVQDGPWRETITRSGSAVCPDVNGD